MTTRKIPKIIHQTWKTKDIPFHIYKPEWINSWKEKHPDWEYIFWTDESADRFIKEHYSWFYPTYSKYPYGIYRADAMRYFILHKYGGVYVDLDFMCLKNIEPLLLDYDIVLARMDDDPYKTYSMPNAFMASSAGSPFWMLVAKRLIKISHKLNTRGLVKILKPLSRILKKNMKELSCDVEFITGPEVLRTSLLRYCGSLRSENNINGEKIRIYEPEFIYPINHRNHNVFLGRMPEEFLKDASNLFPRAYAVTFWTHNWKDFRG